MTNNLDSNKQVQEVSLDWKIERNLHPQAYSQPNQTSKLELSEKIVNS